MKKETLKQHAYNIIKDKIINCEYAPSALLNEEMLKEDVQASRTPIRDALGRLEQEGLVTNPSQKRNYGRSVNHTRDQYGSRGTYSDRAFFNPALRK